MATNQNATVIYIDRRESRVHYYASAAGAEPIYDARTYKQRIFEREFYPELISILQGFMQKHPMPQVAPVTIVLPDNTVVTDVLSLPAMKHGSVQRALDTTLDGLFKDRKGIRVQPFYAAQSKQSSEVCISGIREELLNDLSASVSAIRLPLQGITFASECTARGAIALNPKLKSGTYLLMDIKPKFTRLVYVLRGEVVSFYTLPFGYNILSTTGLTAEDMLFDHSVAELAVLNARERAKSKVLTVMGEGSVDVSSVDIGINAIEEDETLLEEDDREEEQEMQPSGQPMANRSENTIKRLPKKTPRKLPRQMLRPRPEDEDGFLYENFRIFEKWALCFLAGNERLTRLAKPEAIYMHLPEKYLQVFEQVKAEEVENGIPILSAGISSPIELANSRLEIYGGLFVQRDKNNSILGRFSGKERAHNIF